MSGDTAGSASAPSGQRNEHEARSPKKHVVDSTQHPENFTSSPSLESDLEAKMAVIEREWAEISEKVMTISGKIDTSMSRLPKKPSVNGDEVSVAIMAHQVEEVCATNPVDTAVR